MTDLDMRIHELQTRWDGIYVAARKRAGLGPDYGGYVAIILEPDEMAVRMALNAALAERGERARAELHDGDQADREEAS